MARLCISLFVFAFYLLQRVTIVHCGVYEFIPNTNLFKSPNWASYSCSKDRVVLQAGKEASALYVDTFFGVNELVFPSDVTTEIIIGEQGAIYGKELGGSESCNGYFEYYEDTYEAAVWHDPKVWRYLNITDARQPPLLHSEMIPGQYDTAFFNPSTSHKVVIDLPVRTGELISGGYSHTTETFLDHIETVEGSIQFRLSPDIEPQDFIDEIIMEAFPPVHVMEKECQDPTGCVSYNLNSKIEQAICDRVTDCPGESAMPCSNAFRPRGHCCKICGGMITFQSSTAFSHSNARDVINQTLSSGTGDSGGKFSLIKTADWQYQLILVKGKQFDEDFDSKWITSTMELLKRTLVQRVTGVLEGTFTVIIALEKTPYDKIALGLGLVCLLSLLIGAALVGFRKKATIMNWYIGTRIHLRAFWRDEGDRVHLEMGQAEEARSNSIVGLISGVAGGETSFENPSFKNLLAREQDKAAGAAVYQQRDQMPSLAYDDKSGITFSNPLFGKRES